ncbi:hypothetical protein [Helicobacter pullorum]|uniref:hypothetical protein n=1 Tax=Helicobacter pullorum TaxID=35818 RepID=UPI00211C7C7B|nr:hypothetical protein [Helicobacter pullorum]
MFSQESIEKLKDVRDRIQYIFNICKEHKGISIALEDTEQAQPAIIMHFIVCKENIEKITYYGDNIFEIFSKEEIIGFRDIRDIASYDYDGLNLAIIEKTIREFLPQIKDRIDTFLEQQENVFTHKKTY